MSAFLSDLNEQQLEAVKYISGPLLILAGAGTGKTKAIVSKVAYVIDAGIASPREVLAVTFTNKAATEMNNRVHDYINYRLPWIGTFHSMSAKILRANCEQLSLDNNFTILDAEDQLKLIKNILEENSIDKKNANPKLILSIIQQWKDHALYPEDLSSNDIKHPAQQISARIYPQYQSKLIKMDSVDFGDIILNNIRLFRHNPDTLKFYQSLFKFIFVDEYQDTNSAQYIWLRMLSEGESKLCCVGDDDQSIYGWRGAKVGNILRFEHDFPSARIIKLEQNYRSTKDILNVAAGVISNNKSRYNKTLWTADDETQKVIVKSSWTDKEEVQYIIKQIHKINREQDVSFKEMAVLVRASFQTRVLEEIFISNSVPYRIIGALKFYERSEIKDCMAYLKLLLRQNDDIALERILNKPKRGVGKASLDKIKNCASQLNISLYHAINYMIKDGGLSRKVSTELSKFTEMVESWRKKVPELPLDTILQTLVDESGYLQMLKDESSPEANARIENIAEFKRALSEYSSLSEFLEHVALVTANDQMNADNLVNIMTLHTAKGLEFNTVFLPGWEEGLFPHARTLAESGEHGAEEERRLAYVGITRARKNLFISYSMSRMVYGKINNSLPSRFIRELPKDSIVTIDNIGANFAAPSQLKPTATLLGKQVSHEKFGPGLIINDYGDTLEINFDRVGRKKILKKFVSA